MKIDFLKLRFSSPEVIHAEDQTFALDSLDINKLIEIATARSRKKIRLCVHTDTDANVHQMFIALKRDAYVRPHRHLKKSEAINILHGSADYLIFSDSGEIEKCVPVSAYIGGQCFYATTEKNIFHTLIVRSEWLVFFEVADGPFVKSETTPAPWSPVESDFDSVKKYLTEIEVQLKSLNN